MPAMHVHDDQPMRTRFSDFLPTVNLKRAFGELFLIVLGVLLALAVNNWNTDRQNRKAEFALLRQLHSSLTVDLAHLNEAQAGYRSRKQRIEALRDHLSGGGPYTDALRSDFGVVLGIWPIQLNQSAYEAVKGRGLESISNDSLRFRLVRVYDQVYSDYRGAQQDDRNVVFEIVRPYYLKAFHSIRFRETATPISYDGIVRDPYFRNVLNYRLQSLELNSIDPAQTAIDEVSGLLRELGEEIGRRQ